MTFAILPFLALIKAQGSELGWLVVGVIVFILWLIFKIARKRPSARDYSRTSTPTRTTESHPSVQTRQKESASPLVYRPESTSRRVPILFPPATAAAIEKEIQDLCDAYTGEPINPARTLYKCPTCKVYYHDASYQVVQEANGGRCVSCQGQGLQLVRPTTVRQTGRNAEVLVVTLRNFEAHVGQVVTFEGYVPRVNFSRRGTDVAVMFQDRSWRNGLKMIVFQGNLNAIGGRNYLLSLQGKTVRIRALLIRHPQFGYEFIVNQRSMILSIK